MTAKRVALALLWLVVRLLAGWAIGRQLELSGELRKFMPPRLSKRRAAQPAAAAAAPPQQSSRATSAAAAAAGKRPATLAFTA